MEFSMKDNLRQIVERESGGKNTIMYDDFDNPMIMVWIPKHTMEDLIPDTPTPGTLGAFIIDDDKEIDGFWVSKFANVCAGGVAMQRDLQNSYTPLTFEEARKACAKKGKGWHMMTALEWAAIAWISKRYYAGGRYRNMYSEPRIFELSHDASPYGFMMSKQWEHVDGMRLGPNVEKLYTWLGKNDEPQNRFWENKYKDTGITFDYHSDPNVGLIHITALPENGATNRGSLPSTNFNGQPPVKFDDIKILNENGKAGYSCGDYKVTTREQRIIRQLALAPHPGKKNYAGWCGFLRIDGPETYTFGRGSMWEQTREQTCSMFSYWNMASTRPIAFRAAYIPI